MTDTGAQLTRELDRQRGGRRGKSAHRVPVELLPNSLTVAQVLALHPRELADRVARQFGWGFRPGSGVYKSPPPKGVDTTWRPFNPADCADDDRMALRFIRKHHSAKLMPMSVALLDLCLARHPAPEGLPPVLPAHVPVYACVGDYARALLLLASSAWWESQRLGGSARAVRPIGREKADPIPPTPTTTQRPTGQEVQHEDLATPSETATTKSPGGLRVAPGCFSTSDDGATP